MRNASRTLLALLLLAGCARRPGADTRSSASRADSAGVLADRPPDAGLPPAPVESLAVPPLTALRIAAPASVEPVPPPLPAPDEPPPATGPVDRLPVDDALRPPILRTAARWPVAGHARGWVELDVLVDEHGEVAEARPAGGTGDTATVRAALAAAHSLRYYPARQGGRPVAVWCRQRFDSGR